VGDGLKMASFLQKYTEAMTLQIKAIQAEVDNSVGGVMQALQGLSLSTEQQKKEADRVLEATYLNPDAKTAMMVDNIQKSTDDIFEQAQMAVAQEASTGSPKTVVVTDTTSDVRRMGGMFSKHMESLSTMDDSMKDLVMTMVGSLSNADVIRQRLDHIAEMLRAMDLGISNVIVDLDARLNLEVVESFKEKLLDFSYGIYSIEQERSLFKGVFGPPPSLVRAYNRK
jgi:hypothetical protein